MLIKIVINLHSTIKDYTLFFDLPLLNCTFVVVKVKKD